MRYKITEKLREVITHFYQKSPVAFLLLLRFFFYWSELHCEGHK